MTRRRWSNQYLRRFPNHEIGMDVVCYNSTTFGYVVESGNGRTNQQKKVRPSPKIEHGKKNEIEQEWRKKKEDASMDRHYAFNSQVISAKA